MNHLLLSLAAAALLTATHPARSVAQVKPAPPPVAKPAQAVPININTASVVELQTLPGIGAKTAARILEYRQKNGPFKKIEELMNVRGVGEKSFVKLKARITVVVKAERATSNP